MCPILTVYCYICNPLFLHMYVHVHIHTYVSMYGTYVISEPVDDPYIKYRLHTLCKIKADSMRLKLHILD